LVQFKESIDAALLNQISNVDKIEQLQTTNLPTGQAGYKLQTTNPESVRRQLLELSLQHNLNIVSLQSENYSLEEVFRNLTN